MHELIEFPDCLHGRVRPDLHDPEPDRRQADDEDVCLFFYSLSAFRRSVKDQAVPPGRPGFIDGFPAFSYNRRVFT